MRPEKFLCLVLLITITDAPNLRSQAIGSDRPTPAIFGFPIALGGNLPAPFGCNDLDLAEGHNTARNDPSWAPIIVIPGLSFPASAPPSVLEGYVESPPAGEKSNAQAPSEVAEEDTPWSHHSHDITFKVIPDRGVIDPSGTPRYGYGYLLSSRMNPDGSMVPSSDVEVEWESHALPRFAEP